MKFTIIYFFILLKVCFLVQETAAQTFPTKHYTIREGLAQMQVMALLEDSHGFLWAGTKGGLSRYDGRNFRNYHRSKGDSLVHNMIWSLKEDSKGNIWICSNGGVNKFDGANFKSWLFPDANDYGKALYITPKDEVFVVSELGYFQVINDKLVEIKIQNSPQNLIRDSQIYDIEKGRLIISYRDNNPKPNYYHYELIGNKLVLAERKELKIANCFEYGDKGIIYTYQKINSQYFQYWFLPKGKKKRRLILTVDVNMVKVHQTLPFNFAFAFQNKLSILEKNTTEYQQLADGFLYNNCVQVDKTGIWAGTETGLWRVIDNGIRFLPTSRDAVVWSIVEDKNNRLWTLHYNSTVPIKLHEGKKTTDLVGYQEPLSKQLGKPFANLYYYQPLKDQYQNLWIPSSDGLIRYDYNKFHLVFNSPYSFFLVEDKKRNLIISSVGGGVNIVENKPPYKVTELREKDGLHPNSQMLCVFVDSQGTHWYGSKGLTRYDYDKKMAYRYEPKSKKMPFRSVFFIVEDAWNTLWFGTTSGLFRYLPESDSFIQVAENTIKGFINAVGILDKKHLICTNEQDVFVFNLADYQRDKLINVKTFNYNNGFMGLEPGQAGFYKTHDGKMWLTSSDVLSIFDPKELDLRVTATKPIFTKIDGQIIPFTKNTQDSVYQLPKGKISGVRIEFGSTGFDKALQPNFSYQLDGGKWSAWQEEPFVNLYDLSGGEHLIKIKTQVLGEQKGIIPLEADLKFRTNIQFWQSPNFIWHSIGFSMLLFVLLLLLLYRWLLERRMLKEMEEHKQELDFMRVAANQAQMNPHFIFNILQVLQSYVLKENFELAKVMIVKLANLVRNYLEATVVDTDNEKKSIYSTEITLAKELELLELFVEFEHTKGSHKFDYEFKIGDNIEKENISLPPMIIQPIVENAIKHGLLNLPDGEKGKLTITVRYYDKTLCFIIEDTGVGIKRAEEIKASAVSQHKSMAQKLVKRKIELLNKAGYKINSIEPVELHPHGTSVKVLFDNNE